MLKSWKTVEVVKKSQSREKKVEVVEKVDKKYEMALIGLRNNHWRMDLLFRQSCDSS